ncbi:MAG: MATE family efflux transporter [Clostridia bacterium]|nr:MATE family efflux transporter [Clostridia bacterium]
MVVRRGKPNFTEGPIFVRLLLFTVPIILTGLLQVFYNMADNIIVGQFSGDPDALAAVGQTNTTNSFIINLIIGISAGAGVVVAQLFGANRKKELSRSIHTAMTLSLIMGAIMLVVGLIVMRPVLSLIVKPELLDKSTLYMLIICIGYPAMSIYNFGASIVRSLGDSKTPLIILAISGIINVGLNVLFVVPLKMSIAGVAIATVASQYFSAIAVVILMMKQRDENLRYDIKKLMLDRGLLSRILYCGVPAGIQSSIFSFSNMLLTSAISTFPVETISGNTIASNIDGITYTCMNSFTSSVMTFAGQNYGAMKKERIWKVFIFSLIQVTAIGVLVAQTELLFAHPIASLFVDGNNPNKELIVEQAIVIMQSILNPYFLCGIMSVMAGFLRGLGNSTGPMITAVTGVIVVRLVWIYVFFPMNSGSIAWLNLCYPLTWIFTILMNVVLIIFAARSLNKLMPKSSSTAAETVPEEETVTT